MGALYIIIIIGVEMKNKNRIEYRRSFNTFDCNIILHYYETVKKEIKKLQIILVTSVEIWWLRIFFRISTGQRLKNRPVHGISHSTVSGRECTKRVCEPRAARVAHCRPLRRSARPLRTEHSSSAQPADGWHSWTTDGDRADNNNNND